MKKIKKLKSLLLLFTMTAVIGAMINIQIVPQVAQVAKASPTAQILVDPKKSSGKIDGTFTIKINVADVDDLYGVSVYLTWNPTIINYNYKGPVGTDPGGGPDVTTGPFFTDYIAQTPESDSTFLVVKSNQTEGWLDIATGLLGSATGVPGPAGGTAILVTFRVRQVGATLIDIVTSKMLDHFPNEIPHTVVNEGYYRSGDLAGPGGLVSDEKVNIWDLVYIALGWGKTVSQLKNPTAWVATAGGGWVNPGDAATSNNVYATSAVHLQAEAYYNYQFVTTEMNVIKKVLIGFKVKSTYNASEPDYVRIYVSKDGGTTYATYRFRLNPMAQELYMWADMTAAYAWTPANLADASFRVKIEYFRTGYFADTISLDWIPVKVEYTQTAAFTDPNIDVSGNGLIDANDLAIVAQNYGT